MGGLVNELKERISREIDLPDGYSLVFDGQYKSQQRAQARLMIVVPTSLALIFLLLYFAFGSLGQAALIMTNVPLALIGGIIALWSSELYLSVPSSIGFYRAVWRGGAERSRDGHVHQPAFHREQDAQASH